MLKSYMNKIIFLPLLLGTLYGIQAKVTFYDGTYVFGSLNKVDESTVYITPMGLDTPEGMLVGNIDSLKLENGMYLVLAGQVKYLYENGEFFTYEEDWLDQYDDSKYDEHTAYTEEYKYTQRVKSNTEFFHIATYGGFPVTYLSSLDTTATKSSPNLGLSLQLPYSEVGAVDMSPGFSLMTFGFNNPDMGNIMALQLKGNLDIDFKPIFFFLPDPIHLGMNAGLNYNLALKNEPSEFGLSHIDYDGEPTYGGLGFNVGGYLDYWFPTLPIALRGFFNINVVPQGEPYPELKTGFINVGVKAIIVLKRSN